MAKSGLDGSIMKDSGNLDGRVDSKLSDYYVVLDSSFHSCRIRMPMV